MPVTRTASRALVRSKRKNQFNLRRRREMRDAIKSFTEKPNEKLLQSAVSLIDRAVKHNLIHQNKAARMKSQMSRLLSS